MSEYIITIKQLATVVAKCHGLMPENADGTPICNPREIAELIDEPITLKEIVRCCDCKHWRRFYPESEQRFGTCRTWRYTTRFDGYCHNASKSDGERQGE